MSPFLHLLLIFILDAIPVISSTSMCSSFVCGKDLNFTFTYPFYQMNANSSSLCGYEDLGISCLDQNPTFYISDDAYTVKYINYPQNTLTLVESSLVGESCLRPRHNISWESLFMFELTAQDKNLSFYFNCSSFPSWGQPISCLGYRSMKSYAAIEESDDFNWDGMCEEKVVVPVLESAVKVLGSGSLVGAVQQGFKLRWKIRKVCEDCEFMGRFCGKSNTEERFLCFCKNGTYVTVCDFTPPNGQQPVPTNADVPSTSPNGTLSDGQPPLPFSANHSSTTALNAIISIPRIIVVAILFILYRWKFLSKNLYLWKKTQITRTDAFLKNYESLKRYKYSIIKKMTNSFKDKLGQGGYDSVFKGKLPDGHLVVVKVLIESKGKGEEFIKEVATIGTVFDGQPPFSANHSSTTTLNGKLIAIISIPTIIVVAILFILCRWKFSSKHLYFWKKRTQITQTDAFLKNYESLKRYKYSEIKKMTDSFKDKLGEGGYGGVFKGKLPDGRMVAVKVLSESKGNGEEFVNEVATIGKTYHVNIVSLLGFCYQLPKRALIYEFMPNGSLEKYIHTQEPTNHLGWEKLHKIAVGIARGLEYLHVRCSDRILHLDIKPHNILLDEDFCPKISDFGLAKLCSPKDSTISMPAPRGTMGYTAPEVYCRNVGGVSYKSDVYSYGMLMLEMVGGRKNLNLEAENSSQMYFPHWIYKHLCERADDVIMEFGPGGEEETVKKMILVSLWCIQMDPTHRPSMSRVVEMLEESIEGLEMPPKPFLSSPPRS